MFCKVHAVVIECVPVFVGKRQRVSELTSVNLEATARQALYIFAHVDAPLPSLPSTRTLERDIEDAIAFRQCITDACPTNVCAVCSMYRPPPTISTLQLSLIPNLQLLLANGPKGKGMPRDALTTYISPHDQQLYCLQPTACDGLTARVCSTCLEALQRNTVPKASLVHIDTGSIPTSLNPAMQLAPLTMVEENLVAQYRVCRYVFILKPNTSAWQSADTCRKALRGHVIAFPNVPINQVVSALPLPLDRIPEIMQVIFLTLTTNKDDLKALALKARPLHIRGKEVCKWAIHLSKVPNT